MRKRCFREKNGAPKIFARESHVGGHMSFLCITCASDFANAGDGVLVFLRCYALIVLSTVFFFLSFLFWRKKRKKRWKEERKVKQNLVNTPQKAASSSQRKEVDRSVVDQPIQEASQNIARSRWRESNQVGK